MYKKNWKNICKTEDIYLRMLAATTTNLEILKGLALGFPHLVSKSEENDAEIEMKVFYEDLKRKAFELCDKSDCYVYVAMEKVLDFYDIPFLSMGTKTTSPLDEVPSEWKNLVDEIYVENLGYDIIIAQSQKDQVPRIVEMDGVRYWIAEVGDSYCKATGLMDLITLVPEQFIAFPITPLT
jgi:hypothetical protein